jgi:tyrosine-protein phosphatase YwqE
MIGKLKNLFAGNSERLNFSVLGTDMHSHLIPGIDDGAKNLDHSLALLEALKGMGYQKVVTTPHINWEHYPNTAEKILAGLTEVQNAVKDRELGIEVKAAAEYFLDEHFEQLLEQKALLPIHQNWVLVEFSFFGAHPRAEEWLFKMQTFGYCPILAHPERYLYYRENWSKYSRLRDLGCTFQLNLLSICGYYGNEVRKNAEWLLKKGAIQLLGTDLHHERHVESLQNGLTNSNLLQELLKKDSWLNTELV